MVKNLPAMRETQVWFLYQEDPLEEGLATHSSILAWRITWTEEPGGLQSMGLQRVGHDWATNTFTNTPALQADFLPFELPGKSNSPEVKKMQTLLWIAIRTHQKFLIERADIIK